MAVTGVIWIGYVVVHMYGNLKVFQGSVYFNEYAEGLRELAVPCLDIFTFFSFRAHCLESRQFWLTFGQPIRSICVRVRARPSTYAVRRVV